MKRRIPALCSDEQPNSSAIKRTKVHAQRKFAQGSNNFVFTSSKTASKPTDSSLPSTLQLSQPASTVQKDDCELNNFSSLPTIDDFLTFLCFRETEVLPKRLDYLNTPQFDVPLTKKKSMKSNTVSFQELKTEDGKDFNKNGSKPKSSSKKKNNKSTAQDHKLRSHNVKNNIVRKPSRALALKHNQRLRSKSVVEAKRSENKLQNFKNKTAILTKVIPRPAHTVKNILPRPSRTSKARPMTRANERMESFDSSIENDFRRVTRRNSTIDRNDSLSMHCAKQAIKNAVKIKPTIDAKKKSVPAASKKSAKFLKITLPKFKNHVPETNTDEMSSTLFKPITRSSRSEESANHSITTNSRPSRRTKEAAALYMEMLGKELLCPDENFEDDDDDISVDSFPELPNTEELHRREKELKEMHLKKSTSKTQLVRKTCSPRPKPVAKVPIPEASSIAAAVKTTAFSKEVISKEKPTNATLIANEADLKNAGLCTRSKQYKPESAGVGAGNSSVVSCKEQLPSSAACSSSVKIIRTRVKNEIAAIGAHMSRRNSCNDAFDAVKRAANIFIKDVGIPVAGVTVGARSKQRKSSRDVTENVVDEIRQASASEKKSAAKDSEHRAATDLVINTTESVTIKRLSSTSLSGKHVGCDEKPKKMTATQPALSSDHDGKTKKVAVAAIPRRSSEPVIIEQPPKTRVSSNEDFKTIKSLVFELNEGEDDDDDDDEDMQPLSRHQKCTSTAAPVGCASEKSMMQRTVAQPSSGTAGSSAAAVSGAIHTNNSSNSNNSDPVIIERIPSRKNSELKSTKRSNSALNEEKHELISKKVEDTNVGKAAVDNKFAEIDRKSSIAETKSKIANHNLSVKSSKNASLFDGRSKKSSSVTSTAATTTGSVVADTGAAAADIRQKEAPVEVKTTCEAKPNHVAKSHASVAVSDDLKTAKLTCLLNEVKVISNEKQPLLFNAVMTFDDSDDEFLVPPKPSIPAAVKVPVARLEPDEHAAVSSSDDTPLLEHISEKPICFNSADKKCTKLESPSSITTPVVKREVVAGGATSTATCLNRVAAVVNPEKRQKAPVAPTKTFKSIVNNAVLSKKTQALKAPNMDITVPTVDAVVPKCEAFDDFGDNQTFALDMYDDSTEECEKLLATNIIGDLVVTPKQELMVTTSNCISSSSSSSRATNNVTCTNSSSRSNSSGSSNSANLCIHNSSSTSSSTSSNDGTSDGVSNGSDKNGDDFKKPVPQSQPAKSFFASTLGAKVKTAKDEKLAAAAQWTTTSSSLKGMGVDSKKSKIIFKKNSCVTPTPIGSDVKDEMVAKKSEAFSPDNENSVYAFEPDLPTTSPPFRRLKPVTPTKSICSNSIAVQVNFENDTQIECSGSGDTQVSSTTDCGDRVYYIPIHNTPSTLGLALKLGTDGPTQKIIMSAKLITDSATFSTSSTSTSISSKSTFVETCCTQTESPKMSAIESVIKKVEMTSSTMTSKKGSSEKVVTSSDGTQTIQIPCNTTCTFSKTNKKPLSSAVSKPNSQSVKIVKLNKNKKAKDSETESLKTRSRPAKPKSVKKSNPPATPDTDKAPSMPAGEILEAPTFYPSAEEFSDPLEYIDTIRSTAEKYGLCRIVPPSTFRPECKVADEMRFTAYNQYVHKMLHRWGPNVKEMMAIKKFLSTQSIALTHAPWIGGMEIDLPRLYQIVQQCGGLNAVIEKERWHQVADIMKIPKLAQDRITKLDDIYCKYLLPYDVLSHNEREKLFEEIEEEWLKHLKNPCDEDIFDDVDECIVKGRTMPLSCFYRIARNTMMMCFGNMEGQDVPSTEKIEEEFWNHVSKRKSHVCVHSGSIDSGTYGYGFSMAKNSTFRKHPWNLKVLTNNSASILRSLGPVMGVTVPTLHVGMLYSACCWYRDPHGLPWIEYLHTGANKIWYGIPDEHSEQFKEAMLLLVPRYCRDKKLWLPSDTVMIPPPLLTAQNISLSRVVQHPGQFIVVFPKAFTSSISTGYLVSESVYFAHASWLNSAKQVFKDMQDSCEPSIFSLEQLLISIAEDARTSITILNKVLPLLVDLHDTELALRHQLNELGLNTSEKLNTNKKRKSKSAFSDEELYECEVCRANLFVSLVENSHDQSYYCLSHAASLLYKKPAQAKHCKLLYAYTEDGLKTLTEKVSSKIEAKSGKKTQTK